ncbi:hypothetical protein FJY90_02815 [Candidatus Gottesmanbacteria bacterium]|nr:hypothetical protein [Candidatus Gottesmanbacteria bacterium]
MNKQTESAKITIDRLPEEPLTHRMIGSTQFYSGKTLLTLVLIILAGVVSGYLIFSSSRRQTSSQTASTSQAGTVKTVGSSDVKTFRDTAEGTLEEGSINGEGTHRLIRPGGESQTVYLTSSILDLNQFIGKKVRVWGETFAAKRAGWLMDVGKIEVL